MAEDEVSRSETAGTGPSETAGTGPSETAGTGPSETAGTGPSETAGTGPVDAAELELESVSSQMAYDAYLPAVKVVEPGSIEECCADVVLTYHTVMRGVESVVGSGAVTIGKLPNVSVEELSMLPRLAQGLAYASLQVHRELKSTAFGPLFDRAQTLRRKLRKTAEALAETGLLSDADADEVRLRGPMDVVEDCLALAAVFRRNEVKIAGRSPVTVADLREAEQVADKLRQMLGQQGDAEGGAPSFVRSIEMRDRFWTLLKQRHDVLWRCGAWLFGRAVDERVPPLPVRQAMIKRLPILPPERETSRRGAEQRRSVAPPPSMLPVRVNPTVRDSARHLADLQRELERKTRFLVRIGAIPSR